MLQQVEDCTRLVSSVVFVVLLGLTTLDVVNACDKVDVSGAKTHPSLNGRYNRVSEICQSYKSYLQEDGSPQGNDSSYIYFLDTTPNVTGWMMAQGHCHFDAQILGLQNVSSPDKVDNTWIEVLDNGTWMYNDVIRVNCSGGSSELQFVLSVITVILGILLMLTGLFQIVVGCCGMIGCCRRDPDFPPTASEENVEMTSYVYTVPTEPTVTRSFHRETESEGDFILHSTNVQDDSSASTNDPPTYDTLFGDQTVRGFTERS